jgi:small subunit ribosomal protein S2
LGNSCPAAAGFPSGGVRKNMRDISLEELLEAGCHFGHQVNRRNPKASEYIFEARSNIHIINLEKTREGLVSAGAYLKDLASKGGYVVFVGTKRQAKQIVKEEVERARSQLRSSGQAQGNFGIFYVTYRWIGGTLTNFPEVSKNFKKLRELEGFLSSGKKEEYTKREILLFEREKEKLSEFYEGIADMDRLPDALVIIGTQLEGTAVHEAISNKITTVGITDTNADPTIIDHSIPANDDAVGSIKLITSYLADAWIEGSKEKAKQEAKTKEKESKKTEVGS